MCIANGIFRFSSIKSSRQVSRFMYRSHTVLLRTKRQTPQLVYVYWSVIMFNSLRWVVAIRSCPHNNDNLIENDSYSYGMDKQLLLLRMFEK